MPNAGYPTIVHSRNVYLSSPDYLSDYARAYADAGAAIIGGCCGTTPEHIRAMGRALSGAGRGPPSARVSLVVGSAAPRVPVVPIHTSRLQRELAEPDEVVAPA